MIEVLRIMAKRLRHATEEIVSQSGVHVVPKVIGSQIQAPLMLLGAAQLFTNPVARQRSGSTMISSSSNGSTSA